MMPNASKIALSLCSLIPVGWLSLHAATSVGEKDPFTPQQRKYWAFQKVRRPNVPEVSDKRRIANPIDAFIQAKLESSAVKPNPPADRVILIRRVTFDLIGLPPTPE